MEKITNHALIPSKLSTSPLPDYDYDKLDYGMTIGMERTPAGRLWACWVAGGDSPKAFLVLATSDDDGEILLDRFTEQDILARKLVGPNSKLKMLISRPLARNAP